MPYVAFETLQLSSSDQGIFAGTSPTLQVHLAPVRNSTQFKQQPSSGRRRGIKALLILSVAYDLIVSVSLFCSYTLNSTTNQKRVVLGVHCPA